jgi:hypothetical protein
LFYLTIFPIFVLKALLLGCNCEKERRYRMEKLPPEKAAEMLRKGGMDISVAQAAIVLEFLRKLADIVVSNYLDRYW